MEKEGCRLKDPEEVLATKASHGFIMTHSSFVDSGISEQSVRTFEYASTYYNINCILGRIQADMIWHIL